MLLSGCGADLLAADIISIGPQQATAHAVLPAEVELPELQWAVIAPRDPWGTAVTLTGGPFVHRQHPQYTADCRLHLRLLQANQTSGWSVAVGSDQTHLAGRDLSATVAAASQNPGSALLGLRATFVPQPQATLCAGEYVARVVGMVSGL